MAKLTVKDGGLFTTIQDIGRVGYRKYGIPVSGVMDVYSYKKANYLVGNAENDPVLECTLKGGKYQFDSDAVIALTGAVMNPSIEGSKIEMNTSVLIKKGETLDLGFAEKGCRCYLAIRGEWVIDRILGSCSTFVTGKFGGLKGSELKEDDVIVWKNKKNSFEGRVLEKTEIPYFSSKITVEFVPGPEWDILTDHLKKQFLTTSFKVSSKSNRMGIRLETNDPLIIKMSDMKSSGVIPGIIQLPPNGLPIILMKDGQTIGGYPRIGKILEVHLSRLAQLPPNGAVKFKKVRF